MIFKVDEDEDHYIVHIDDQYNEMDKYMSQHRSLLCMNHHSDNDLENMTFSGYNQKLQIERGENVQLKRR